jgi:acyl-CoA reductase-like NAD-dependent aldehyde dehydrogenase
MSPTFEVRSFLNGEFYQPTSGEIFTPRNPATDDVVAEIPIAGKADIDRAVKVAQAAQPLWAAKPPSARAEALNKLADLIEKHAETNKKASRLFLVRPTSS